MQIAIMHGVILARLKAKPGEEDLPLCIVHFAHSTWFWNPERGNWS